MYKSGGFPYYMEMPTFLELNKVQRGGRISLGPAALRNLGVSEGDLVEIYFDEGTGTLVLKLPSKAENSGIAGTHNKTKEAVR